MSSIHRLVSQLAPIIGPGLREKIWLVRFMPIDKRQSDFFRLFSDWEEMLDSMSLPAEKQHPSWLHPFEIWFIDFEEILVQEISEEVTRLIEMRRSSGQYRTEPRENGEDSGRERTT